MSKYSKEDIINLVEENDVEFIRLQFTDILGNLKNVAITKSQLQKALDNKCMFDASSIDKFMRTEEADMYLKPDLDSFVIFPWRPQQGKVARLICNLYTQQGEPFEGDSRYRLQKVLQEAKEMGYTFKIEPKCEFFLFHTDEEGRPTNITHDTAGYFDLGPIDRGENARRDICLTLEEMGFEVKTSHHEMARGQHEVNFKEDEALKAADNVMTFKLVVKSIAQRNGLYATFMPKPTFGAHGSGMHLCLYLNKDGKDVFLDASDSRGNNLSNTAYNFIAGVMEHIKGMTAVNNPLVNSYKRLIEGYEAPVDIAWSTKSKAALLRVPESRDEGTRIELRSPDPCCNPYLALADYIAAGLDGIKRNLIPVEKIEKMTGGKENIEKLPQSLSEAVSELKKDKFIKEVMGEYIVNWFIEAKTAEWNEYRSRVTQWEIDNYLGRY